MFDGITKKELVLKSCGTDSITTIAVYNMNSALTNLTSTSGIRAGTCGDVHSTPIITFHTS